MSAASARERELVHVLRYGLRWLEHRTYGQASDIDIARRLGLVLGAYSGPDVASGRERELVRVARALRAYLREYARIEGAARLAGQRSTVRPALGEWVRAAVLAYEDVEPEHDDDRREWRRRLEASAVLVGARIVLALVALLTWAPAARAAAIDWKPAIAAAVGQTADAVSTVRFLSNGSRCVEGNALYGTHPSAGRLLAVKAPTVAAAALLAWRAGQPGAPRWVGRLAGVFGYGAGITGGAVAVLNVRACGF